MPASPERRTEFFIRFRRIVVPNPQECKFTKSHEWLSPDGTVGISDHAQKEITDVVFVDLPQAGRQVKAGDAVAVVESVKAAFDIYAPVSGTISKVNDAVAKDPAIVNQSPFDKGWLFAIEAAGEPPADLMNLAAYEKFLESGGH